MIFRQITVIDPVTLTSEKKDLYVSNGVFTDSLEGDSKQDANNGDGLYAAPGFMDLHVHCGPKMRLTAGIPPDRMGIRQGVTTLVDAGSAGIDNFAMFQRDVIRKSTTRVLFFLNIARTGLATRAELKDMGNLMTADEFDHFRREHGENLVGIKVRMSRSALVDSGISPLVHARDIAQKAGLPLMVHIGNGPPTLDEILDTLSEGDIVTHCFHGKKGGLADCHDAYARAVERGVCFDVGHGSESFSIHAVDPVLKIRQVDFSISTDLHRLSIHKPVGSLMATMSKFFTLGYGVEDVVRRVTVVPSRFIGRPCPPIQAGEKATMTIFRLVPSSKSLIDSEGNPVKPDRILEPVMTFVDGECVWGNHAKV